MKLTGIVRRIDDLGRLVIPKEIRKVLKIRCGDSIEIFVNENNNIELNKFSPLDNSKHLIKSLVYSISKNLGVEIVVFDFEKIISSSKKTYENEEIDRKIIDLLNKKREIEVADEYLKITDNLVIHYGYIKLLHVYGNELGGMILYSDSKDKDYKKIFGLIENFLSELEHE